MTGSDFAFVVPMIVANGAWLAHCILAYRKREEFESKAPEYAKAIYCEWGDPGAISWPLRVAPLFLMKPPKLVRRSTLALRALLGVCLLGVLGLVAAVASRWSLA